MQTPGTHPLPPPSPASLSKKAYLALLTPAQIIDICLAFEPYAPTHLKNSIWPVDLNAAISALQDSSKTAEPPNTTAHPPMGSLSDPSQQTAPSTSQEAASSSAAKGGPHDAGSASAKPGSALHAPFAPYPYHPTYPHAPYYASQPPPPGYPSSSYPPFPQNTPHHHHPSSHPLLRNVPSAPQDDLPSYEEMIVEAIKDFADPEGVAPKDLFTWMASHYPLQTNFRPSASQALQKAFKRGRLEKGSNGKYRLNPSWEGGNTSRRTTRRPQTQAQTIMASPTAQHAPPPSLPPANVTPFTHTPLHRHAPSGPHMLGGAPPGQQQPPYPYFPYPYPTPPAGGFPGYSPFQPPPPPHPGSAWPAADEEIAEGSDAWKAAQNILKAIAFDGASVGGAPGRTVAVEAVAGPSSSTAHASHQWSSATDAARLLAAPGGDGRAELRVHLALLAAQLMGIAQAKESEEEETRREVSAQPVVAGTSGAQDEDNDTDGEEDPTRGVTTRK